MTKTCCVPGCRTNLRSDIKINGIKQVFRFPARENQKFRWLKGLNIKKNIYISKNNGVCIKHFNKKFLELLQQNENIRHVSKYRLTKDACPSIGINGTENLIPRCSPQTKKEEREIKIKALETLNRNNDIIENFEELCGNNLYEIIQGMEYFVCPKTEEIYILKVDEGVAETMDSLCITIKKDLTLKIFFNGHAISTSFYSKHLKQNSTIKSWNSLKLILEDTLKYKVEKHQDATTRLHYILEELIIVEKILQQELENPSDTDKNDELLCDRITFIKEQLKNYMQTMPRYSTSMIIFACSLFYSYPAAYRKLRETNMLILPHPSYLKRMEGKVTSLGTGIDETHKHYLREKRKSLDDRAAIVSVLLDEIYSKPEIRYSGGQLHGVAQNSSTTEAATTVQTFMIKSIFIKNTDIVALFPVKTLTSDVLLSMTLGVLKTLVDTSYTAISLVSDNNRVNRKMFELLCNGVLEHSIPHPYQQDNKLFLLFDAVHGFKNIRNNWICNFSQTFVYPDPHDLEQVKTASFYHLKLVYEKEKHNLVKMAPGLCNKALAPSNLERQNLSLVLKVANEKTISALEEYKEQFPGIDITAIEGTACFLKMYVSWWNVVNVKSVSKGFNLRNPLMKPVHKEDCIQLQFLQLFSNWLDAWDKLTITVPEGTIPKRKIARVGKLTCDTQLAIKHTTESLIAVSTYCLTKFKHLGVKYVLLGLFQDDSIERRFGRYRTMNGASYHVTVDQILQTERKLKVISLLKHKLKNDNNLSFDQLRQFSSDDKFYFSNEVLQQFDTAYEESVVLEVSNDIMKVLVSIAGYCAKKVKDNNNCATCLSYVSTNATLEDPEIPTELLTYMQNFNRGGLKIPKDITLNLTLMAYKLFITLTSERYVKDFINAGHQKQLFLHLAKDTISMFDLENELCPSCEKPITLTLSLCLLPLSNIFLNNYTKNFNDHRHGNKLKVANENQLKKQRKLITLQK